MFHALLRQGIHLPPSPYETFFLSTAHGEPEITATVAAFDRAFAEEAAHGRGPGTVRHGIMQDGQAFSAGTRPATRDPRP